MPNRILKESICSSETLDSLTPFEETVFYRLIVKADDFGRFDARPKILRSELFPLKDRMPVKEMETALASLVRVGCVEVYYVNGKPYLEFVNWDRHQVKRAKYSKYPNRNNGDCDDVQAFECDCEQMQADVSEKRETRNEKRETRNEKRETRIEKREVCAEPHSVSAPAPAPDAFISMILNDGTYYDLPKTEVEHYKELFPAVNVEQEIRSAVAWAESNPKKRKTKSGAKAFFTKWLIREQNNGRTTFRQAPTQTQRNQYDQQPSIPDGVNPFDRKGV